MTCRLTKIDIERDTNEYGELAYLVTATYDREGVTITVPDTKGWRTRAEAIADAERMLGRKIPA